MRPNWQPSIIGCFRVCILITLPFTDIHIQTMKIAIIKEGFVKHKVKQFDESSTNKH